MQKHSYFIWSELSVKSWLACFSCLYACNNIQSVPDIFESKIGVGWQWPKRLIYHITNSQYLCLYAAMWVYGCILTSVWVHAGLCESGCVGRAVAVRRRWRWCWRWAMESSADPGVHTDTPRPPQRPLSVRARGRVCRDTERENSLTHTHLLTGSHTHKTKEHTHTWRCVCVHGGLTDERSPLGWQKHSHLSLTVSLQRSLNSFWVNIWKRETQFLYIRIQCIMLKSFLSLCMCVWNKVQ